MPRRWILGGLAGLLLLTGAGVGVRMLREGRSTATMTTSAVTRAFAARRIALEVEPTFGLPIGSTAHALGVLSNRPAASRQGVVVVIVVRSGAEARGLGSRHMNPKSRNVCGDMTADDFRVCQHGTSSRRSRRATTLTARETRRGSSGLNGRRGDARHRGLTCPPGALRSFQRPASPRLDRYALDGFGTTVAADFISGCAFGAPLAEEHHVDEQVRDRFAGIKSDPECDRVPGDRRHGERVDRDQFALCSE